MSAGGGNFEKDTAPVTSWWQTTWCRPADMWKIRGLPGHLSLYLAGGAFLGEKSHCAHCGGGREKDSARGVKIFEATASSRHELCLEDLHLYKVRFLFCKICFDLKLISFVFFFALRVGQIFFDTACVQLNMLLRGIHSFWHESTSDSLLRATYRGPAFLHLHTHTHTHTHTYIYIYIYIASRSQFAFIILPALLTSLVYVSVSPFSAGPVSRSITTLFTQFLRHAIDFALYNMARVCTVQVTAASTLDQFLYSSRILFLAKECNKFPQVPLRKENTSKNIIFKNGPVILC